MLKWLTCHIFFEYADSDPRGKVNISPIERFSLDFIMDAIWLFQMISRHLPLEAKVFWHWYVSKFPAEFDDCPEDGEIKSMIEMKLADWDFAEIRQFLVFGKILTEANP